jgi:hypothetical protein
MFKLFIFLMGIISRYNVYSQESCIGDIDNNLNVDVNDLLNVLSNFNNQGDIIEDIDNNGIVDVNDLLIVLSNYGNSCNDIPVVSQCLLGDDCGGQIWNECGTSCPLICGTEEPMLCNMMCNVGYQCPSNMWWDNNIRNCVSLNDCSIDNTLPPDIAIGRPYLKETNNIISDIIYEKNDWN